MRIAISGATGMIGKKLMAFFLSQGHQVVPVSRHFSNQTPAIIWDPAAGYLDIKKLEGFDVIIHLTGADVSRRWTSEHQKEIWESRVQTTRLLCESLGRLALKPKILICASAVGFYGSHPPQEMLDEESPGGTGFLAQVCRAWEEQAGMARRAGIRVVCMRLGVVLSKRGGVLKKMWLPFKLGLGGRLGNGKQMMSWIALDEIPYVVEHFIKHDKIDGAVNVVSPQAVSNAAFTLSLGQVIHRPVFLPIPAFAIRFAFGQMGQVLLLEGAHVVPRVLLESGYRFQFADLKAALKQAIA